MGSLCLFEADDVDDDDDSGDVSGDDDKTVREKRVAMRCSRAVLDSIHRRLSTTTTTTTTATTSTNDGHETSTSLPSYKPYTSYRLNACIRSFKHRVKTVVTMKKTLNRSDDKRYILNDRVHTLAHGHYKI
ncbi:uncharacterized protein LOC112681162 [Sipha flava]|uniref:Uncharacterized protein LOC112681162 n=2 Tax=Sipha flava TaxID=143950 RepID=A0A8B8F8P5_9HEMI|nr:uncharacterized protein LOC112681162 [Sipha flava]